MNDFANQAGNGLKDFHVADVRDRVANLVELFADQVSGAARNTEQYIRSNPWQALGAIALLGIAAGMLVTRSSGRVRGPVTAE